MTTIPAAAIADPLVFKIATERVELDQVHQLNYRTFVEEIPQHHGNADRALVDRFHDDNTYFICKRGPAIVGMIAVRARRPFSLDDKLPNLDDYLPAGWTFCEVRLLAVDPEYRNGVVFRGLIRELTRYCFGLGINASVISGAVSQLQLYEHMGFVPFGPRVGTAEAPYQPMYCTFDAFRANTEPGMARRRAAARQGSVSFLPGPVDIHPDVRKAYAAPPVSHRDDAFIAGLLRTKQMLCELTSATHVEILLGSGTLANDVIAMQLAALDAPGLVLSNGEFGERLIDHASRAGLRCATERLAWGDPLDAATLDRVLARHVKARWCWMVHHETSTGVLNDLDHAAALCRTRGTKLAGDCVSSIGVVPVDLRHVFLASGVSGKAIGGLAGLSMVFHEGDVRSSPRAPRYLDLSLYADAEGVPFTQSSGLVSALRVATENTLRRRPFSDVRALSEWLRQQLRDMGFRLLAADEVSSPGIVTLVLEPGDSAIELGDALARAGFALSYRSKYLRERNWIQIALMGECSRQKTELLLRAMRQLRVSAATRIVAEVG
jgi:aspartate aminotransferase-like enzyme/GNAT superfamily N-acetyltransferase